MEEQTHMSEFEKLWNWINKRGSVITVQERTELEHVYNLMKDCNCKSYLEIGSAEGNSLYVLGHVVGQHIDYVDYGEVHTEAPRNECIKHLEDIGKTVTAYLGDSTNEKTLPNKKPYDCVLIDGGHDYATVLSDAMMYAGLAKKYVFFHDVQLAPVREAIEFYLKRWNIGRYGTFINSDSFGYGIIEVGK